MSGAILLSASTVGAQGTTKVEPCPPPDENCNIAGRSFAPEGTAKETPDRDNAALWLLLMAFTAAAAYAVGRKSLRVGPSKDAVSTAITKAFEDRREEARVHGIGVAQEVLNQAEAQVRQTVLKLFP